MTSALEAAIASVIAEFEVGVGTAVVDLGAGDGARARLLSASGARVIAIEPSAGTRTRLAPAVPTVEIIDGHADAIPLPEWTADLVVVGTPSEWLGTDAAVAEVHRVLRPGGALAVIGDALPGWTGAANEQFSPLAGNEVVQWYRKL